MSLICFQIICLEFNVSMWKVWWWLTCVTTVVYLIAVVWHLLTLMWLIVPVWIFYFLATLHVNPNYHYKGYNILTLYITYDVLHRSNNKDISWWSQFWRAWSLIVKISVSCLAGDSHPCCWAFGSYTSVIHVQLSYFLPVFPFHLSHTSWNEPLGLWAL